MFGPASFAVGIGALSRCLQFDVAQELAAAALDGHVQPHAFDDVPRDLTVLHHHSDLVIEGTRSLVEERADGHFQLVFWVGSFVRGELLVDIGKALHEQFQRLTERHFHRLRL